MISTHVQALPLFTGRGRVWLPLLTVLLTAAVRHPLKNGMEAAGIESSSLPRIVGTRHDESQQFRDVVGISKPAPLATIRTNPNITVSTVRSSVRATREETTLSG